MFNRIRKGTNEIHDLWVREAFSLRDEIGTCPNIEIDIDVMDRVPFLLDLIMGKKKTRGY